LVAFLANNFWLYITLTLIIVWLMRRKEHNPIAMFFVLLFAVPPIDARIGGLNLINYVISIDYLKLLVLAILLPTWWKLRQGKQTERLGSNVTDQILILYLSLIIILRLPATSLTDGLRFSIYLFIEAFLPYYVASRAPRDISDLRDALGAFVLAALILALIAVFETTRHWLLYSSLDSVLGLDWDYGGYVGRGTSLRAVATAGQAIVLGYILVVALGLYWSLWPRLTSPWRYFGLAVLFLGLVAPFSRGPWVAAATLPLLLAVTGDRPIQRLLIFSIAAVVCVLVLLAMPFSDAVIDHLPFVGTLEAENVTYRQLLMDYALLVIRENPWLGSWYVMDTPELQLMRQGEGIIDLVNSYLAITLTTGVVGLILFASVFFAALATTWRAMRLLPDKQNDYYRVGQSLLVTIAAIMIMIGTVSSILSIPFIYWSMVGLCTSYRRILGNFRQAHLAAI
jgi:O-antigen ligase